MKYSLVLLAGLGLFQMAQAQTPHTPPSPATMAAHQVQRYTTLLSLNSAQVEQATAFFTAEATSHGNARATERTAHQALEAAIKANDTATIKSTAATLGQMNGEMMAAHAPVSYTHLDVYKRQTQHCVLGYTQPSLRD